MADEKVQTEPLPEGVPENTEEQNRAIQDAEAAWEEERSWPIWEVEIEGPEVEWRARPGVNEDDEGNPQPWNAPAHATVQMHAPSEDFARARALQHNPGYHKVLSVKTLDT